MGKLVYLWFAMKTVLCNCQSDHRINHFDKVRSHYKISKIGKLSTVVSESSGLARATRPNTYLTHNDSGGKPELYEIDSTGKLLASTVIENAGNTDWEDLAQDELGNIYIGDIGNNGNTRRSLDIYKLPPGKSAAKKISFSYTDQKQFPPAPENMNFDCEAFFYSNKNLYLFSKNRSKSNHQVRLYEVPSTPGQYAVSPLDSIIIKTQVTSADISPDGKTFALLTYGKILLFEINQNGINFKNPKGCFRFVKKQAEALIFINNTDMLVTNEQGDLFRIARR
jgi:hypothetical protein